MAASRLCCDKLRTYSSNGLSSSTPGPVQLTRTGPVQLPDTGPVQLSHTGPVQLTGTGPIQLTGTRPEKLTGCLEVQPEHKAPLPSHTGRERQTAISKLPWGKPETH